MAEYITRCIFCGSREFCVVETLEWDGVVDERGFLDCTGSENSVESIACGDCGEPHAQECFANFDHN
jgi:hypothetical protein